MSSLWNAGNVKPKSLAANGSEFQTDGRTTAKLRGPYMLLFVRRTTKSARLLMEDDEDLQSHKHEYTLMSNVYKKKHCHGNHPTIKYSIMHMTSYSDILCSLDEILENVTVQTD